MWARDQKVMHSSKVAASEIQLKKQQPTIALWIDRKRKIKVFKVFHAPEFTNKIVFKSGPTEDGDCIQVEKRNDARKKNGKKEGKEN